MAYPIVPLGDVADISSGFGFPKKYQGRTDEDIPFFKVGDMNSPENQHEMVSAVHTVSRDDLRQMKAKTFPQGTVVMPKIGAAIRTGKKRVLGREATYDNNVVGLIPREDVVSSRYLYQWALTYDFARIAQDADVPSLRKSVLAAVGIPLPPLEEQKRIADLLDEADRLQRLRKEANEKAQRILPALFIEMFGDPETNPMEWEMARLGDITAGSPKYGAGASSTAWVKGSPRYVRITDIDDAGNLKENSRVSAKMPDGEMEAYRLQQGDLLFARSGATVGKVYLHRTTQEDCVYAGYLIRFRADTTKVDPAYLFGFTRTAAYRNWITSIQRPTAQPNINAKEYSSLSLPVPPLERQRAYAHATKAALSVLDTQAGASLIISQAAQHLRSRLFAESA